MRTRLILACSLLFGSSNAEAQILDAWGDTVGAGRYRAEMGQTIDTDGNAVGDLLYYSEGHPVTVWLHESPAMTFSFRDQDTIYSVRMDFVGEGVDPGASTTVLTGTADLSNYYLAHTGAGVVDVPAAGALVREEVYPRISVQHYIGAYGPKMAFVMEPGAEPAQIQMLFSGQDSLGIDWQGAVRAYVGERFLRLEEAFAYQVINGSIVPVSWSPDYDLVPGGAQLHFEFGTFDVDHPLIFQIGPPPPLGAGGGSPQAWRTLLGSATGIGGGESWGNAAVVAPDGDLLIAGNTLDHVFPAINGIVAHAGVWDLYYGRFEHAPGDPLNDAKRVFMTYYGGTGSDKPIVAHYASNDVLWIGGWTNSENAPIKPFADPADGSYWQGALKGDSDGLLLLVDPVQGNVLRSTYLGGEGDEMLTAVTEDVFGNLHWGGATSTSTGTASGTCTAVATGFPLCDPGGTVYHQSANGGGTDLFLVTLDPGFSLLNSTFYGGAADDLLFDLAYYEDPDPSGQKDLVIGVGRTDGNIPQGTPGAFWLPGVADSTGFIITFMVGGALAWTTNLHGLERLEAAVVQPGTNRLLVLGTTHDTESRPVPTADTCGAVNGTLSICDPGGGAYQDDVVEYTDQYFAEFDVLSGQLFWSTTHGGSVREDADDSALLEYDMRQYHPFLIRRFCDLVMDDEGTLFALGIAMQTGDTALAPNIDHPTLAAFGFYNQPWRTDAGRLQTDVLLSCFDAQRQRVWATTFGAHYVRIADYLADKGWRPVACDWGHSLALVPGEALYWAGSSGGVAFDEACPYPGVSWCEPSLMFGDPGDVSHGFVARMNLQDISIGLPEVTCTAPVGLSCYPNPAIDHIHLAEADRPLAHTMIDLFDGQGRLVLRSRTDAQGGLSLPSTGQGLYTAVHWGAPSSQAASVRFVKR